MEANFRWAAVAAVAPVAWGSSYLVTRAALPPDSPLWGAAIRALPAGLLLLLLARRLPHGAWWWRAPLLGTLNVGAFFVLVYLAAQLLPSSVAATLMATSPAVMMLLAWPLLRERPRVLAVVGAAVGFVGVAAMLLTDVSGDVRAGGVAASLVAMSMSSVGFVLTKRWASDVPPLRLTAWQLSAGGLMLLPVAGLVEGAPPAVDGPALAGFAFLALVATAVAYVAWLTALQHLDAGAVGLVGLLNPVTGVALGTGLAGERLTVLQGVGIGLVLAGVVLGQPVAARWWRAHVTRRSGPVAVGPEPVAVPAGTVPVRTAVPGLSPGRQPARCAP